MAKLPAPEDYGASIARPSRTITSVSPDLRTPDVYTGQAMINIGEMVQKETDRLDDITADDSINKLREARMKLTLDPEQGFQKVQGGEVTKRKMFDEFPALLKAQTEGLASGITSAKAKAKFNQQAANEMTGFQTDLMRHVAVQTDKFQTNTFKSGIDVLSGIASASPDKVNETLDQARGLVDKESARQGLTDPLQQEAFRQDNIGLIHSAAINGMLTRGDSSGAATYLEANKGALSRQQLDHLAPIVKGKNDWSLGNDLADQAASMYANGSKMPEIEKMLADKTKDNKEAYSAAQSIWSQRQSADKMAAQEQMGSFAEKFWLSPNRGTMNNIMQSSEYLALPGNVRGQLSEHMIKGLEHESDRIRARRNDQYSSPEAFTTFLDTMEDPDFPKMTRPQIYGLADKIGPQNIIRLLGEQKTMLSGATGFKIDPKLVDDGMPSELRSSGNKDKASAYRGIVAMSLQDWKQSNPGKTPDQDQQIKIMRSALDEYTVQRPYWFDAKVKAYELKDMPVDFIAQANSAAAAKGLPKPNTEQLRSIWSQQKGSR